MSDDQYLIWWLPPEEIVRIKHDDRRPRHAYIRSQLSSLDGRNGRGRLWCAEGMPQSITVEWNDRNPIHFAASMCGGIVIKAAHAKSVRKYGFITTLAMELHS